MAVRIIWHDDTVVRNSNEEYKIGIWYVNGIYNGVCEIPLDENGNQKFSDSEMLAELERQVAEQ